MALVNLEDDKLITFCETPKLAGSAYPELIGSIKVKNGIITKLVLAVDAGGFFNDAVSSYNLANLTLNVYTWDVPSHHFTVRLNGSVIYSDFSSSHSVGQGAFPAKIDTKPSPDISVPSTPFTLSLEAKSAVVIKKLGAFHTQANYHSVSCSGSDSYVYDNIPPHITLSFGGATLTRDPDTTKFKYYTNSAPVEVKWSAVDSMTNIKSIDRYENNSLAHSVTSDDKMIYVAPKGSYGPWYATATDEADNTNDYSDSSLVTSPIALDTDGSFELVVDPDPPEVDIALSSTSNIVDLAGRKFAKTSSVQLQITATDDVSGCKEIDLYLNGTLSSSLGTSASSATVTAAEGANIVQIYAKDYAGNEAYTGGVTFYYNSSPPVGYINFSTQDSVLENGGKYWTKESQINVDLTYGDGGLEPSGIYKGLVVLNGAAPTAKSQFTESLSGTSKTNHTVSGLKNGSNTISFYVINNVEKISAGDSITIWVETNDSTGTMAGVEATSSFFEDGIDYTNTNKHDVNLTHSDSDSQLF